MIKGFVFDLDGVITDTAILHFRAWKSIVKTIGIDYDIVTNDKLRGLPRVETLRAILKIFNKQMLLSEKEIIDLSNKKNELYIQYLDSELDKSYTLPNIEKFLKESKENNIKLSIASSSYNAIKILDKLQLLKYFDFIVNPADVKNGKPAPDIFIQAAQGIGLTPCQCIGFEDALAGLEGIVQAKMYSVVISHNSKEDFSKADYIVNSTNDLNLEIIRKKFNF
ncbi:beta-phosphoglucomutase [Mycoplasmopsis alligatoris]|uniref:Beta-phosphoglucomutase n=1 Tax=Mycoplasmopsis alligatoris A21JP2 TaxID=747682 RepID=D4XWP6_9BACT|nr:beta-phosphoglucomutase [Mycoplasmopsis alligatoris]EFF41220.1 beta-phosphoglucomutase [Mycoplasmopsis alligatoris A21JP2]